MNLGLKLKRVVSLCRGNLLLFNKKKIKRKTRDLFIDKGTQVEIDNKAKLILQGKINIRRNCTLSIRDEGTLELGERVFMNEGCKIISRNSIKIGDDVQLGQNVMIFDHDHEFKSKEGIKNGKFVCSDVVIGNNVWIGANTIILRGTEIGDNCVIAAGSVIKGQYLNNTLVIQTRQDNIKKIY